MEQGERLRAARQFLRLKQNQIARELGFSSNFLSNIEGGRKKPPKGLIEQFSLRYNINANWILTGQGDMAIEKVVSQSTPLVKEIEGIIQGVTLPKFTEIESRLSALESLLKQPAVAPEPEKPTQDAPLYTAESKPEYSEDNEDDEEECEYIPFVFDIAAGQPITMSDDRSETVAVPAHLMKKGRRYYAARVRGGSMVEAGIHDGALILIRYENVPRDNAIQVVRYQDKATLKRLRELEGNRWELHYRDGSGRVISCETDEYETLGEFEAILPEHTRAKAR